MGIVDVDQIDAEGGLVRDADSTLSGRAKDEALLTALPGARAERYAGVAAVRCQNQVIFRAQVTHLGYPWPEFKKRIQIPKKWVDAHNRAVAEGLTPRFVGIYLYGSVTIFVDFDPSTYVLRKANNSAAHVATNDLHQAQTAGEFSRVDRNGNRLTSVRADLFADYLAHGYQQSNPALEVFKRFNEVLLTGEPIRGIDAVKAMHAARWPDTFQGEWPGFYLEHRLDGFVRDQQLGKLVAFQKEKRAGQFDYDLAFGESGVVSFYGDLKASNILKHESPGNDADDIRRCVEQYGKFWYVIYEHDTWHARDNGDLATIEWNHWKRDVGFDNGKPFNELSYSQRFKEAVRFAGMKVLEVNTANFHVVLGDFTQGKQPSGASRALKVMINKRNIDNFLIYSAAI